MAFQRKAATQAERMLAEIQGAKQGMMFGSTSRACRRTTRMTSLSRAIQMLEWEVGDEVLSHVTDAVRSGRLGLEVQFRTHGHGVYRGIQCSARMALIGGINSVVGSGSLTRTQ